MCTRRVCSKGRLILCPRTTAQRPKALKTAFSFVCLIEAGLIYTVVLVSGTQQSDPFIYIHNQFFVSFSMIGYYKIVNIVPLVYLFYIK